MLYNKKLSLIIPCRNEEKGISAMLQRVPSCVDEVLVIDNCSTDKTATIARKHGAKVFMEKRTVGGIGYGFAHQKGMQEATGNIIITMDGDGTYPLESIPQVIEYFEKNKMDFVSCNRFPLDDKHAISWLRQLGVNILNLEVAMLYRYKIKDILSGMWVVKKECIKELDVIEGGWELSSEIKLAAITHQDIRFSEYHIHHEHRLGNSKLAVWRTGFKYLFYIMKRRFGMRYLLKSLKRKLHPVIKLAFSLFSFF